MAFSKTLLVTRCTTLFPCFVVTITPRQFSDMLYTRSLAQLPSAVIHTCCDARRILDSDEFVIVFSRESRRMHLYRTGM